MATRDEERAQLLARYEDLFWKSASEGQRADQAEAERDALRAEILDLRASVEAFLRGNTDRLRSGDTTADLADLAYNYWHLTGWTALNTPESHEDARDRIHKIPDEDVTDIHGRTWDPHLFVQSRAVDNVRVCICGQSHGHHIHDQETTPGAPTTPTDEKETP